MTETMVIVGAGEAGARAASSLRERGFGGSIILVGNEAHAPYERPPLSKACLTADEIPQSPVTILDERKLAEQSIKFLPNVAVEAIDRNAHTVLLNDGSSLTYSKLLLATGASSRRLNVSGASDGNVLYLRTFTDAIAVRNRLLPGSRLIIVGGGFIGLELAASATARGCRVTLLEVAPRILMRGVTEALADRISAKHKAAGVEILTAIGLERIADSDPGHIVILQDGRRLECDLIVAGVGAIPETSLAVDSGLSVENGIRVDEFLRSDDPDIFAAGDCCSFPHKLYGGRRVRLEAWRNAQDQGAIAAANMLGVSTSYDAVPWFWSDQYDETLQVSGLLDPEGTTVERPLGNAASLWFHSDHDGRLIAASAFGANQLIAKDIRVAEMLIGRRARPAATDLSNPSLKLKDLLREAASSTVA